MKKYKILHIPTGTWYSGGWSIFSNSFDTNHAYFIDIDIANTYLKRFDNLPSIYLLEEHKYIAISGINEFEIIEIDNEEI